MELLLISIVLFSAIISVGKLKVPILRLTRVSLLTYGLHRKCI